MFWAPSLLRTPFNGNHYSSIKVTDGPVGEEPLDLMLSHQGEHRATFDFHCRSRDLALCRDWGWNRRSSGLLTLQARRTPSEPKKIVLLTGPAATI